MAISGFGKSLALLFAGILSTASALAGKPEWGGGNGGGHGNAQIGGPAGQPSGQAGAASGGKHVDAGAKHGRADKHAKGSGGSKAHAQGGGRREVRVGAYFDDHQRNVARTYFSQHYGGGKSCPPGLAKKGNGCMPPGIAKQWTPGKPLPTGVAVYPLPPALLVQLPPPPVGHRYVRVSADIVLIASSTRIVIDGMPGLIRF